MNADHIMIDYICFAIKNGSSITRGPETNHWRSVRTSLLQPLDVRIPIGCHYDPDIVSGKKGEPVDKINFVSDSFSHMIHHLNRRVTRTGAENFQAVLSEPLSICTKRTENVTIDEQVPMTRPRDTLTIPQTVT